MEFLRFGSSIPGEYWGCCAGDIIQNFKQDPDTKASIQLVSGDGGGPLTRNGGFVFLGPTLRDIFWQRLRVSTFGTEDMPNHFFLAVLEDSQLTSSIGSKWLSILKEAGFEFIRTVDNSVYTGAGLDGGVSAHKNHIFGLFRNIGKGKVTDPFKPPAAWTKLSEVVPEAWQNHSVIDGSAMANAQRTAHRAIWDSHGPTRFMTEAELVEVDAPVIMAGLRSEFPPALKATREARIKARKEAGAPYQTTEGTQYLYNGN